MSPILIAGIIMVILALLAMLTDAVLLRCVRLRALIFNAVPGSLHIYSPYAFIRWVVACINGALIVAMSEWTYPGIIRWVWAELKCRIVVSITSS